MTDKLKVGNTVYLKPIGNNAQCGFTIKGVKEAVINKIGRKYFYASVDGRGVSKFSLDSMLEYSIYSPDWKAYHSLQGILDGEAKKQMCRVIYGLINYESSVLTLNQIKRIHAIALESEQ